MPVVVTYVPFRCIYHGRPTDLSTGRKVPGKGIAKRVVKDLIGPFVCLEFTINSYTTYSFQQSPIISVKI